ncbi:MAG: M20/M25/M40 family metallo-hydrolase [Xanthomonadales bacterium]|nr:M20/M25/M40 family metallo-hydrolase [Xanthomonadales bacterium]
MRMMLLACLLAAPLLVQAETPARLSDDSLSLATQLREQAMAGSGAYDMVESLTTEVGPRLAGSEADARAVAWAAAKFKVLGFDKVYTEPVRFPTWRRGHERAEVLSPYPQPLRLTALGGSIGTGGTALEAEVVEFATLKDLEAAAEGTLDGKIAYVSQRMQRFRSGKGYGEAVAARGAASVAAQRGAVAYLLRSVGTDHDRLPHTGLMRYRPDAPQVPAAALSNPDADLLSNMLKRGQPVKLRLDIDAGPGPEYESANVIGELVGSEHPEQVVVIGGHLDSWDLGTGAIDDAAGVAITARAAALIAALPRRPKRSIRVIAFANEEQGLLGGFAYAKAHAEEVAQHQIGAESDFGVGRIYAFATSTPPEASRTVVEQIAAALEPLGIHYRPGQGDAGPDVSPMAELGMAWAWLAQDGTDYFNYHHTANDTLDKVDAKDLDQNVAAYAVFSWLAADAPVGFGSAPRKPE